MAYITLQHLRKAVESLLIKIGNRFDFLNDKVDDLTDSLEVVAFSGDYNDLDNTPTIPTIPTHLSSFINDVGYLTTANNQFYAKYNFPVTIVFCDSTSNVLNIQKYQHDTSGSDIFRTLILVIRSQDGNDSTTSYINLNSRFRQIRYSNGLRTVTSTINNEIVYDKDGVQQTNNFLYPDKLYYLKVEYLNNGTTSVDLTFYEIPLIDDNLSDYMKKGIDYVTAGKNSSTTLGNNATAEGYNTTSSGNNAHAEGANTIASGSAAHSEGGFTNSLGNTTHSEGYRTLALANYSHVEGNGTFANGNSSHAEGNGTGTALNLYVSDSTRTNFTSSAIEPIIPYGVNATDCYIQFGSNAPVQIESWVLKVNNSIGSIKTVAPISSASLSAGTSIATFLFIPSTKHSYAHAEGASTIANDTAQHVGGKYNLLATGAEVIGGGSDNAHRANIRTLDWSGNETLAGKLTLGAGPTNNMDAATKQYVDNSISNLGTVFNYKGTKATQSELPSSGNTTGDVWLVSGDNTEHIWNGTAWEEFGPNIDLSGYVVGPNSSTNNHVATFNGTDGRTIQDSGYTIEKSVPSNAMFTDQLVRSVATTNTTTKNYPILLHSNISNTETAAATKSSVFYFHIDSNSDYYLKVQNATLKSSSLTLGKNYNSALYFTVIQANQTPTNSLVTLTLPSTNGTLALTSDIPSVPSWALQSTKPTYTATEVGALPDSTDLSIYMQKGVDYVTAGKKSDTTLGTKATAEGNMTTASGGFSHAEGYITTASNSSDHAEGIGSTASGGPSHAEGNYTTASAQGAHAEGRNSIASAHAAHAEGDHTTAAGTYAHAEGYYTAANKKSQHVFGEYNIAETLNGALDNTTRGNYVEIVGNGTADDTRSNARTLDWSGNEVLAGKLTVGAGPTNAMDVATKTYVDTAIPTVPTNVSAFTNDSGYSKIHYVTVTEENDVYSADTTYSQINTWLTAGDFVILKYNEEYFYYRSKYNSPLAYTFYSNEGSSILFESSGVYYYYQSYLIGNSNDFVQQDGQYGYIMLNDSEDGAHIVRQNDNNDKAEIFLSASSYTNSSTIQLRADRIELIGDTVAADSQYIPTDDTHFTTKSYVDNLIPTTTSDLTNDSGFITSSDVPVTSVNTKTGTVTLSASDVGAIPSFFSNGNLNADVKIVTKDSTGNFYWADATNTPANYYIAKYDSNAYLYSTTPTSGDNSTKVATTAFVTTAISSVTHPVTSVNEQTGNVLIDKIKTSAPADNTTYNLMGTASTNVNTQVVDVYNPTLLTFSKYDNNFARLTVGSTSTPGQIRLYSSTSNATGYIDLKSGSTSTNTRTITFPDATGTVALTSDIPNVSSWALAANKPSYTFSELTTTPTTLGGYGITDAYTKTEVDGLVSGVLHYKGVKATVSALPSSGNTTGDVWHITADGSEYAWDGSNWQELGTATDLSGYVPTSRTVNGKALSTDITLSASDVSALPSNTTYVSTFNGQSGAITYTAPVTSVNGQTGAVTITDSDEKLKTTNLSSSSTQYYPLIGEANQTASTKYYSTNFRIKNWNNNLELQIGQNSSNPTRGSIKLVSNQANAWVTLQTQATTERVILFPDATGTLALTSDIPSVPSWALESTKPTYTASEVGALASTVDVTKWNGVSLAKSEFTATNNNFLIPYLTATTSTEAYLMYASYTPTANAIARYNSSRYLVSTTPAASDNSTKAATTAFVKTAIGALTIPTRYDSSTNTTGYLTMADLPIYDGTVI